MSVRFRDARRDDVAAIVAMLADDDLGRGREAGEVSQAYYNAFDAMAAQRGNRLIVADEDGKIVGTFQMTIIPGLSRQGAARALIEAVRVSSDARGRGLGEAMMDYAISEARMAGCRLMQLTSDRRRERAHAFYERLGFQPTHIGFKLELA